MSGSASTPVRCDVWLWDGDVEYEGILTRMGEGDFAAHMREARRGGTRAWSGQSVTVSFVDLQHHFAGRKFLACFRDAREGELVEAGIISIQRSSSREFSFLLCGRYRRLDPSQQEALRKLSIRSAAALIGS